MSRMLYQDKDGEWIAAGSKDWIYHIALQVIASAAVRFVLPFAYCIYYVRYWHLNSLQVVQAFTRDSIVRMSTGPSIPVD
jgi:hypothetical protein